ncbi:MAG: GSCFA domain-containing protein [Candidatus Sericytochromatia bacterium]
MAGALAHGAFPYDQVPPGQVWSQACSPTSGDTLPAWPGLGLEKQAFITPLTRIVSVGSCFAHAIAHYLQSEGYHYLVTEPGPPWLSAEQLRAFQYGLYSARYGHIYTTLQLQQLIFRAWEQFSPADDCWPGSDETQWLDPFRPRIQPGGFVSPEAMRADRQSHLAAVKSAFSSADLMIVTLGLSECWRSRLDGAVYPVCPGRGLGQFDPKAYYFENLALPQIEEGLRACIAFLAQVNPTLRWILTLSPVPLAVTAEKKHVLEATGYSKAVLRVAIENICREFPQVDYFPAYEWVMYDRAQAFETNGRQVRAETVQAIMRRFEAGFVLEHPQQTPGSKKESPKEAEFTIQPCDEEALLSLLEDDFLTERPG